jgi:hypothetical protein
MKNVFYRLVLKPILATIPLLVLYVSISHSQQPPSEDKRNCKKCNQCEEFQTTSPPEDFQPLPVCTQGKKLLLRSEPQEDRDAIPFGLRDMKAEEKESLIKLTTEICKNQPLKEEEVSLNLAKWFAKYYGDKAKQDKLTQRLEELYTSTIVKYKSEKKEGEPTILENEESEYRAQAKRLADFFLAEREIFFKEFKDFPEAQKYRYEEPGKVDKLDRKTIEDKLYEFIRGEYFPNDYKKADLERKKAQQVQCKPSSEYHAERGSRKDYIKIVPNTPEPKNELPRDGNACEKTIEEPCTIGIETRIFVAEHPPWNQEVFRVLGLYHTSILAGRWKIVRTVVEKKPVDRKGENAEPEIAPVGDKIEKIEKKFYGWYLANGCSGDYNADDELRLVDYKIFSGKESLIESAKYLSATLPDQSGHLCRSRYGVYPMGRYGFNWLCHQAANAFACRKWGITPVLYWPMIFYSLMGNRETSDVSSERCTETAHPCLPCVSGAGCCGQRYPTSIDFRGRGYNLELGWHPTKEWIKMINFKYEKYEIPICGWDEVVYSSIPQ